MCTMHHLGSSKLDHCNKITYDILGPYMPHGKHGTDIARTHNTLIRGVGLPTIDVVDRSCPVCYLGYP